ncbi:MAG TPA: hypothetical protein VFI54_20215 [Solirubrobacteraceae bacterium]|nr:hypothetical protein [Solirubrobacteraceae bacterium]
MHVSIWKFTGEPDELTRSYDEMLAEFPTDHSAFVNGAPAAVTAQRVALCRSPLPR